MIGEDDIKRAAEAGLQELGNPELFLVEVRRMPGDEFEVTVDSDGRVTVDDCIVLSRAIEGRFDRDAEDFALTVSSAGIGQPLKVARQYLKLVGKPAEVVLTDGTKILGTLEGFEPGTAGAVKAGVPGNSAAGADKGSVISKSAAGADKAGVPGKIAAGADKGSVISKIAAGVDKGSSATDVGADKGGSETGGRDNVMVGGTAGSCGAGGRSDPGNDGGNSDRSNPGNDGGNSDRSNPGYAGNPGNGGGNSDRSDPGNGGGETGGRDNVMVGGTAGSCGAGDRSDPGNDGGNSDRSNPGYAGNPGKGGGGNDDRSDRSHQGGIEGGSISISYPEKRKVEGKKKPEVATVTRTFPLAQVKTTKEYMDFK